MSDNINKLPHAYNAIFNNNSDGILILDDLWSKFYDSSHKTPLDSLELAFQAGQRHVVRYMQLQRDRIQREQQGVNDE